MDLKERFIESAIVMMSTKITIFKLDILHWLRIIEQKSTMSLA